VSRGSGAELAVMVAGILMMLTGAVLALVNGYDGVACLALLGVCWNAGFYVRKVRLRRRSEGRRCPAGP
jgi:hypothetical protein